MKIWVGKLTFVLSSCYIFLSLCFRVCKDKQLVNLTGLSWNFSYRVDIKDCSPECAVYHQHPIYLPSQELLIPFTFPNVITSPGVLDTKYQAFLPQLLLELWNGLPVLTLSSSRSVHAAGRALCKMHIRSGYTYHLLTPYIQHIQSLNSFTRTLG